MAHIMTYPWSDPTTLSWSLVHTLHWETILTVILVPSVSTKSTMGILWVAYLYLEGDGLENESMQNIFGRDIDSVSLIGLVMLAKPQQAENVKRKILLISLFYSIVLMPTTCPLTLPLVVAKRANHADFACASIPSVYL